MNILLDMNLSPSFCDLLETEGWHAMHWQDIGEPDAPDREIMSWALDHGYIVCTNDLDFGALLAQTLSEGPSVIQIRLRNLTPLRMGPLLVAALRRY